MNSAREPIAALSKGLPLFSEIAAPTPFMLMSSKALPGGRWRRSIGRREPVAEGPVAGNRLRATYVADSNPTLLVPIPCSGENDLPIVTMSL